MCVHIELGRLQRVMYVCLHMRVYVCMCVCEGGVHICEGVRYVQQNRVGYGLPCM